MKERVFVDKSLTNNLPDNLVNCLRDLVMFLDRNLHGSWDIHVCPFMNGDRPHLVLFNPYVGLQFVELVFGTSDEFEVEEYRTKEGLTRIVYLRRGEPVYHLVSRVARYRDKLIDNYIPEIRAAINERSGILAAFRISLFFPEMSTEDAQNLIADKHCIVFGRDDLKRETIGNVVPDQSRKESSLLQDRWIHAIRDWLWPDEDSDNFEWSTPRLSFASSERIHPDWKLLQQTRRTQGEVRLAHVLCENLPHDWEIFIEPFLNGDRPDVVLLNPQFGIWVIEVKDWNPENYKRDGNALYVINSRGEHRLAYERRPEGQLQRYRDHFSQLAQTELGGSLNDHIIRYALYLHKMTATQGTKLFAMPDDVLVIGRDNLDESLDVIIDSRSALAQPLTRFQTQILRSWLLPPDHYTGRLQPVSLNKQQERYAHPQPGKHRIIQGAAGSGKSLVLAVRAATLASEGKSVLIVSFNITLWHYLRSLIGATGIEFKRYLVQYTHFHGFCKDFLAENEVPWPSDYKSAEELFLEIVPALVRSTLKSGKNAKKRKFDAILIDEGQDFAPIWYDILCEFLSDNDEVLIVSDPGQNVYHRHKAIISSGIRILKQLNTGYRLPGKVRTQSERFARLFLPDAYLENEPVQLGFDDPKLFWVEVENPSGILDRIYNAVRWLMVEQQAHPSDIVILVPDHVLGQCITNYFTRYGIPTNHIFGHNSKSRGSKVSFEISIGKLKVCTIHSFKGWELSNVIIITPTENDAVQSSSWSHFLFYTAMTRTKRNLIVFNSDRRYTEYGYEWHQIEVP